MQKPTRQYSPFDHLIFNIDQCIRTLFGKPNGTDRPNPATNIIEQELSKSEIKLSSNLMRINHTGEVCAQALYQGQAITAQNPLTRDVMHQAAIEENDHLLWCEERLKELGSHTSYLNPLWYIGSLSIGLFAGICGDKWSLGFLAETEIQVGEHLKNHLAQLPMSDHKSRAIVEQMWVDETHHADMAVNQGGAKLPWPVKSLMQFQGKVMTSTVFYI